MKERPILFSGPMVRAILADEKTQTRRLKGLQEINQNPNRYGSAVLWDVTVQWNVTFLGAPTPNNHVWWDFWIAGTDAITRVKCPYGQVGDRLWVRENTRYARMGCGMPLIEPPVWYSADGECPSPDLYPISRPAIFMPRWASRITLEITNIRAARVQDITNDEAEAEGARYFGSYQSLGRNQFRDAWVAMNGKGSWSWNDWVWVIEFKRLTNKGE